MTDRQRIQQIEELLSGLIQQSSRTEERVEMLHTEPIALRDKIVDNVERNARNVGWIRQEIAGVRRELKADIAEVGQEVAEVRQEVAGVKEELVGVRQEQTSQRVLLERILDRLEDR